MVVTDRIAVFNSLKEEIEDIIGETANFRAESEAAYRRQLRRQEVLYGAYVIRQHKRQNFADCFMLTTNAPGCLNRTRRIFYQIHLTVHFIDMSCQISKCYVIFALSETSGCDTRH